MSTEVSPAPVRVMESMNSIDGTSSTPASAQPAPHSKINMNTLLNVRRGFQSALKKRKTKYSAASRALDSMK